MLPQDAPSIQLYSLIAYFCASPAIQHLIYTTSILFPDLDPIEKDLGTINAYFNYYFPERETPLYFTYVSEFGIGTFTIGTEFVGIGLDFFLGEYYPYYHRSVFHNYMLNTMTPAYLTVILLKAVAESM